MWLGRMNMASTRDAASAATTTLGMMENASPRTPSIMRRGKNAAQLVRVDATTGQKTSWVPMTAAFRLGMPSSMCR